MLSHLLKGMRVAESKISKLFECMAILSGISIFIMMVIVTVDASTRKFWGNAIYGSYDIVSYLLCIFVFTSFIGCQLKNAHFSIDIITSRLSHKKRMWITSIGFFIAFVICWLMAYRLFTFGLGLIEDHATAMELTFIPTYPFPWFGAFCFALLGIQFFFQAITQLESAVK